MDDQSGSALRKEALFSRLLAMLQSPSLLVAQGFGAGLVPHAPGTAGAVLGIPLFLALDPLNFFTQIAAYAALFALGVWACDRAGQRLGNPDHQTMVWDEVWAMAVVCQCAPAGWPWMIAGFAAFRLFDIAKPWPIRPIDRRLKNGFGVMMDDALAAVFAIGVLWAAGLARNALS